MHARDIMSTRVVTVLEDTSVEEVASTLLRWHISAVPVLDATGDMVGIVSEGDLIRRADAETAGSWWLAGFSPQERARRYAQAHGLLAKDVMTTPVVTATANATLPSLAALLEEKRIKRVPIVDDGRLVGIVSRANLLHGIAAAPTRSDADAPEPAPEPRHRSTRLTDSTIRASILNTIHNELELGNHVNVVVAAGTVDLWGGVETEAERQAVRAAAENAPGVVTVNDHLSVFPAALRKLLGRT